MHLMGSGHTAVTINGTMGNFFRNKRGLRQGDPISPYLFLLAAEGLSCLLKAHDSGVEGISVAPTAPSVNHLLFADDSIVFLEGSHDNFLCLREILQDYEGASGQKVNLDKSAIFFGNGCDEEDKVALKQTLGISSEALSERYLGYRQLLGNPRTELSSMSKRVQRGRCPGGKSKDYPRWRGRC